MQQRGGQLGAGAPERVAEGDGPAVDVEPRRIDGKLAQAGECLSGECFVELDEVDLIERQAGHLQDLSDCRHRSDAEALGFDTSGRKRDEPRQRRRAPSARARSADITTTAAAPSLVCDELPAVTVPVT